MDGGVRSRPKAGRRATASVPRWNSDPEKGHSLNEVHTREGNEQEKGNEPKRQNFSHRTPPAAIGGWGWEGRIVAVAHDVGGHTRVKGNERSKGKPKAASLGRTRYGHGLGLGKVPKEVGYTLVVGERWGVRDVRDLGLGLQEARSGGSGPA